MFSGATTKTGQEWRMTFAVLTIGVSGYFACGNCAATLFGVCKFVLFSFARKRV